MHDMAQATAFDTIKLGLATVAKYKVFFALE
jgi:hypothetical protein